MTVAAIDCGTNSIRLLIAREGEPGELSELDRRLIIVRLGQGVDATGEFHIDALDRTFAAVDSYATAIADAGVDQIRFVATSAARDVANREVFFSGVQQRLGVLPEIISGSEEARLSFLGAVRGVAESVDPVLVMDIGGGSTELIIGQDGVITSSISLDLGSVRLTERCWHSDPPADADVSAATALIDRQLDRIEIGDAATWIGVAGTATSMSAIVQGLAAYDRQRVHGSMITIDQLRALAERLRTTSVAELRQIPSLHPQRADVIGAGALIADRVSRRVDVTGLRVSESDILDGIALELLAH